VAIWLMNGLHPVTADLGNVANSLSIVRTARLQRRWLCDILWRNTNGDVAIWLMTVSPPCHGRSRQRCHELVDCWHRDFNGDGKGGHSLAQHEWRRCDLADEWLVAPVIGRDLGNVATSWTIVGTGDFNGDGIPTFLWRNTNGDVAIWLMNGLSLLSIGRSRHVATSWSIVEPAILTATVMPIFCGERTATWRVG